MHWFNEFSNEKTMEYVFSLLLNILYFIRIIENDMCEKGVT